MARLSAEAWLPEEYGGDVITRIGVVSAIEAFAKTEPMTSDTKWVPRSATAAVGIVPKGSAYPEDTTPNDLVLLNTTKFGEVFRIAEEDIDDSLANLIDDRKLAWANSYATMIDNACLGTTVATTGMNTSVPFTSVYASVALADSTTGYTAGANLVQTAVATAPTYANLSALFGKIETGRWYDESKLVVIAHPSLKGVMRGLVDSTGKPIFLNVGAGTPDTLFGFPIKYSQGAKTSAVASYAPTGNPLLILGNTDLLRLGKRSGPESVVIDGKGGASALTDETLLKMRARRAFAVGAPAGFAVLEMR